MGPLIGRQREVDEAWHHLGASPQPTARVLLVEGPAGIGKTAFLAALAQRARARGAAVLTVALTSSETSFAWAGVASLCRDALAAHRPLLPPAQLQALANALGEADGPVDPTSVASATATLLAEHLRLHGEVVLVLDDLHWLDVASAGALAFAIRANAGTPLRIVAATRPGPRPLDVLRTVDRERAHRVELPGLDVQAVKDVLADRFGLVHHGPELLRLHGATEGNPLYALEIGRMVAAGSSLDDALVPPSLDALIDEHLAGVAMGVLEAVQAAALLATPTTSVIARLFDDSDDRLLAAEEAGLVLVRGDRIGFAHPLLRAGVVKRLAGMRRRQLTRRLADVVEDADERARLLGESTVGPDEAVAELLVAAGERALVRGAPQVAVERLERALAIGEAGEAVQAVRHLRTGLALSRAAEFERSCVHARQALEGPLAPADEAVALTTLAISLNRLNRIDEACDILRAGAERLRGEPLARLGVLNALAGLLQAADLREGGEVAASLLAEARAVGDDQMALTGLVISSCMAVLRGLPLDVDDLVATVAATDADPGNPVPSRPVPFYLAGLLGWVDRHHEAIEVESAELARSEAHGHVPGTTNALSSLADSNRRIGRWDEALASLRRWVELIRLSGLDIAEDGESSELAWLLAARGEHDEALTIAAAAVEGTKSTPMWHVQAVARVGFVHLVHGDLASALDRLEAARDLADEAGFEDLGALQFRDDLVEALVLAGRMDEAVRDTQRIEQLAARAGRVRGRLVAARARALVAAACGNLDEAEVAVVRGIEAAAQIGDPFEEARLLLLGGVVARRAGRRTQSRDRLDHARRLFDGLGARPFVAKVDAELARLGDRTGRRDQLTHTERQVAELVAAGRTNAEAAAELFITPRTVEAHLTRIYRKLGVRSRAELIAKRAELDLG